MVSKSHHFHVLLNPPISTKSSVPGRNVCTYVHSQTLFDPRNIFLHCLEHMRTLQQWKKMVQTHSQPKQWENAKTQGPAHCLKVDMQVGPPYIESHNKNNPQWGQLMQWKGTRVQGNPQRQIRGAEQQCGHIQWLVTILLTQCNINFNDFLCLHHPLT